MYMEACEMSVCLLRRMSSVVSTVASQSGGVVTSIGSGFSPSKVDENDSRVSTEDWDCKLVFVIIRTRTGALWRAPPPFAVLRIAA